jgi:hypothetical protein
VSLSHLPRNFSLSLSLDLSHIDGRSKIYGISTRPSALRASLSQESVRLISFWHLPIRFLFFLFLLIGVFVIIGLKQRSPLMMSFNPFIKASGMFQTQKKSPSSILGITCHSLFTHPQRKIRS